MHLAYFEQSIYRSRCMRVLTRAHGLVCYARYIEHCTEQLSVTDVSRNWRTRGRILGSHTGRCGYLEANNTQCGEYCIYVRIFCAVITAWLNGSERRRGGVRFIYSCKRAPGLRGRQFQTTIVVVITATFALSDRFLFRKEGKWKRGWLVSALFVLHLCLRNGDTTAVYALKQGCIDTNTGIENIQTIMGCDILNIYNKGN